MEPVPETPFPTVPFNGADAAASTAGGIMGFVIFLVFLAVGIFILLTLMKHFETIPEEHREFNPPGKVWLLLIPLFNLYWMFIVYPGLGRSYRKALAAKGVTDVGDAGEKLGLWTAIVAVASCIPIVNFLAAPASIVLLIMFLVKMAELKKRLLAA